MFGWYYLAVNLGHFAIRTNEIADTCWIFCLRTVGRAVSHGNITIDVTQQIVREVKLRLEGGVLFRCITTHSEDDGIFVCEVWGSITEPFTFDSSTRGVGLRVPPQNDIFPFELFQGHCVAVLIGDTEGRGYIIFVQ